MGGNTVRKQIVIGLDGATFDVLDRYMDGGDMPNLKKMCSGGARGELRSSIPPVTGPSWVSFLTGKNPGKHGIFDFVRAGKGEIKRHPVNFRHIRSKTVLALANEAGKKVGIVNMPLTYPPPEIDGFVITGLLTPGDVDNVCHPAGLMNEVKEKTGPYVMDIFWQFYGEDAERFLDDMLKCTEQRIKAFEYLMKEKEWDLFIGVFIGSDRIQHYLWKYIHPENPSSLTEKEKVLVSKIRAYYRMVDGFMGSVMEEYGDSNVIMVSDHGFGPLIKKIYVNQWLKEKGFLSMSEGKRKLHLLARGGILKLKKVLRKLDKYRLRDKLLPFARRGGRIVAYDFLQVIDWEKTQAYSASNTEQGIYLNLKGREPGGIIEPGEHYEKMRGELIEALKGLRDPGTGEAVITHIYKKEELYTGPYLEDSPDIIFFAKGGAYLADVQLKGHVFEDANWVTGWGTHRMEGIFIGAGPDIKPGTALNGSEIIDLAPTMLRLMGIPIPKDMDGKVLDILDERFKASHGVAYSDESGAVVDGGADAILSEDDENEVAKKLKGLGYL